MERRGEHERGAGKYSQREQGSESQGLGWALTELPFPEAQRTSDRPCKRVPEAFFHQEDGH